MGRVDELAQAIAATADQIGDAMTHPGAYALMVRKLDGHLFRLYLGQREREANDRMLAEAHKAGLQFVPAAYLPPDGLLYPAFWQLPIWTPDYTDEASRAAVLADDLDATARDAARNCDQVSVAQLEDAADTIRALLKRTAPV